MKLSFYSMCQYNGYGLYVADISIQENTKSMNGIFLTNKKEKELGLIRFGFSCKQSKNTCCKSGAVEWHKYKPLIPVFGMNSPMMMMIMKVLTGYKFNCHQSE